MTFIKTDNVLKNLEQLKGSHQIPAIKKNANPPKSQHWVPQFILREFGTRHAKDKRKFELWMCPKENIPNGQKKLSTVAVCAKRFLYSPSFENGDRFFGLEQTFSALENTADQTWDKLTSGMGCQHLEIDRQKLADFFALLHLRNFNVYKLTDKILELRTQLYGTKHVPDGTDGFNFDHPEPVFISQILEGYPRISAYFLERSWSLLEATYGDEFETSDRPLFFWSEKNGLTGPKSNDATVFMPISAKRMLCMQKAEDIAELNVVPVSPQFVKAINQLTRSNALQFVLSRQPFANEPAEICNGGEKSANEDHVPANNQTSVTSEPISCHSDKSA